MSDDGNPGAITNTRVEAIAEYLDGHGGRIRASPPP